MSSILKPEQEKYLAKFITEKDPLIIEMEAYAMQNHVPILSKDSAAFLEQQIRITNPKRVLELGTAIAYSSIRIARNLKKKSVVYTIEKSKDNLKVAKKNIDKSGLGDKIHLIFGNALEEMPKINKKFDFIFLDADKTDYKKLFDYSLILLKKGGIMFVDNLLWHGWAASSKIPKEQKNSTRIIQQFNEIFSAQANLITTILPIGDGIGLGIKK